MKNFMQRVAAAFGVTSLAVGALGFGLTGVAPARRRQPSPAPQ